MILTVLKLIGGLIMLFGVIFAVSAIMALIVVKLIELISEGKL